MSKGQRLRALVNERLTAAAEDIFALFERTIAEYEEELCRSKEENERKQQLLDSVLSPQVLQVHRADVQTQVAIENLKEEAEKCTIQKKGHPQELPFTAQQNQKETEVDCGEAVTDVIIEQHGEIILETEEQIENDGEFQSPFGCSAEQMETEAEGGDYNQVQINDETTDVQIPDVLSKPKCRRGTAKNKRRSAILSNVRQKHQCSVCGKYLKGPKTNLVRHMFLHTGVRPFSCTVCEKSFTQQVNLRKHMENHQKDENEEGQRQTEHMKETQMEDSGVVKVYGESEAHGHSEAETKGQRQTVEHREETQAEDCGGVEAEVESEAHGHSEAETKGHDEKNENQEFPGSSAAQQGEPEVKGEEHSAACTENRCSVCERVFLNKTRLKRHMLVHTGEKPYSCPVCNKLFSQKYNVRLHMAVHTDEKPFTCEVCLKSYRRNDDLRTHMTTHTGEILFTCFVCNTVFKQRNCLKTHMRLHTGDRPYSCTMCSKTFIQKSNLNRHIRIHTGEKPFRCPVCPQRFIQRSDIRRHLAVHL